MPSAASTSGSAPGEVIVPVIVIRLLERLQRLLEEIPGRDFQDINQALALAVEFDHLGLDEGFQARFLGFGPLDLHLDFHDLLLVLGECILRHPSQPSLSLAGCWWGALTCLPPALAPTRGQKCPRSMSALRCSMPWTSCIRRAFRKDVRCAFQTGLAGHSGRRV